MECESLRVLHGNFIRETQLLDLETSILPVWLHVSWNFMFIIVENLNPLKEKLKTYVCGEESYVSAIVYCFIFLV